ncbi:hypothetical protein CHCC20335_4308 [Bacillus paralicheniformis]|nr:hypothetical protein CHCC20335_4308 [Bacillus paralicheniformis]
MYDTLMTRGILRQCKAADKVSSLLTSAGCSKHWLCIEDFIFYL